MSTKWYGESAANRKEVAGDVLVARYVHSGNQEFQPSSIDYATATVTFTQPHGLTIGTSYLILIRPNFQDGTSPQRDIQSIPMEWIKPQGVSGNIQPNTGVSLLPDSATTAKVVKGTDKTPIVVNPTLLENNNNLDPSKFRFEIPIGWILDNLPSVNRMRMRIYGYVKTMNETSGTYRYLSIFYTGKDGSLNNSLTTFNVLNVLINANPYSATAVYAIHDFLFDFTMGGFLINYANRHLGRRAGYNTIQWDQILETNTITLGAPKESVGITKIQSNQNYAILSNGTVVEIYDQGGKGIV